MPELPEVETIRRGMERAMIKKSFKNVTVQRRDLRTPIPDTLEQEITGKKVNSIIRRGKYLILNLSGQNNIILHMGMSGRIHILTKERPPLKHEHVIMTMNDETRISFEDPRRFGMLYLSKNWENEKPFSTMGPEPLSNDYSADILVQRLQNKKAPIKQSLLDQHIIAGLGNIYVCEALYRSGIHPQTPAKNLSQQQIETLTPHIRNILNEAIESGGSTLKDYQHTDGSLGYFQHGFKVYDREGKQCPKKSCHDNIVRIIQSGRSTFFCPSCQSDKLNP